ncbi:class I SAM-dependent methyltransferase [Candidatus Woesearchaeota archaeon]|nr:class I SAM-dependent methyltransferase [Candidatus Woesearchaeota archaeon]
MEINYYSRFKIISNNHLWRKYLRWAYKKCIEDFKKINRNIDFSKKGFTALLCGTSGEITSEEFVSFVLSHNKKARIIILDIASEQLEQSKIVLSKKYDKVNIKYLLSDAMDISLKNQYVDYIETDGFLEYFSKQDINIVLKEWNRILKKGGFITLRDFARNSKFGKIMDIVRIFIGKEYLGARLYAHSFDDLIKAFNDNHFLFVSGGGTFLPTYRRFSLYKHL